MFYFLIQKEFQIYNQIEMSTDGTENIFLSHFFKYVYTIETKSHCQTPYFVSYN